MTTVEFCMRYVTVIVLSVFGGCSSTFGQEYWSNRYDLDKGNDYGTSIVLTNGDTVLILSKSFCEYNSRECTGMIQLNSMGDLGIKIIEYDSVDSNSPHAVSFFNDTIYFHVDYIYSDSLQYSVFVYDGMGKFLESHDYLVENSSEPYYARDISVNRKFIYTSVSYEDKISERTKGRILAYRRNWELEWTIEVPPKDKHLRGLNIESTADDGLILAYVSDDGEPTGYTGTVVKYDSVGQLSWRRTLPHLGRSGSRRIKIHEDINGGLVGMWQFDTVGMDIPENPCLIFKLDSEGEVEWERLDLDNQITLYDVFCTHNGDVIGCGIGRDRIGVVDSAYMTSIVMKLDRNGNLEWERKISERTEGAIISELYSGVELPSNDLMFTGLVVDTIYGTVEDPMPADIWVLKLDSMGCITSNCGEWQLLVSSAHRIVESRSPFVAFPNPASETLFLGPKLGESVLEGSYYVFLYDAGGRVFLVREVAHDRINEIDISSIPTGIYFLEIARSKSPFQSINLIITR